VERARLLVLLSGSGRTMVNLVERSRAGTLPAEVVGVIASRACGGVDRAAELGVPAKIVAGEIPGGRLIELVREARAEYVVLAGYLRKVEIPAELEGRVVNIHPALLPSFGGRGMYGERVHRAVLEAGCKVSGCTVHLCTGEYDRGPILVQRACAVLPDDDEHTLAARVFAEECEAYPAAIAALVEGRVELRGGRAVVRGAGSAG
jgi:phosphoribosylglycinamide formyltransferase 1